MAGGGERPLLCLSHLLLSSSLAGRLTRFVQSTETCLWAAVSQVAGEGGRCDDASNEGRESGQCQCAVLLQLRACIE
jgi:hypothetical protein